MKDILKEMACNIVVSLEINLSWGCTGFDARPARTMGKPKMRKHLRWSREKQCRVAFSNTSRFFEQSRSSLVTLHGDVLVLTP